VLVELVQQAAKGRPFHLLLVQRLHGGEARRGARTGTGDGPPGRDSAPSAGDPVATEVLDADGCRLTTWCTDPGNKERKGRRAHVTKSPWLPL